MRCGCDGDICGFFLLPFLYIVCFAMKVAGIEMVNSEKSDSLGVFLCGGFERFVQDVMRMC